MWFSCVWGGEGGILCAVQFLEPCRLLLVHVCLYAKERNSSPCTRGGSLCTTKFVVLVQTGSRFHQNQGFVCYVSLEPVNTIWYRSVHVTVLVNVCQISRDVCEGRSVHAGTHESLPTSCRSLETNPSSSGRLVPAEVPTSRIGGAEMHRLCVLRGEHLVPMSWHLPANCSSRKTYVIGYSITFPINY